MTIAAERVSGRRFGSSSRRGLKRANKSLEASPKAARNSRIGERIARGSPERIRHKAPDLSGALAPATARVTLCYRRSGPRFSLRPSFVQRDARQRFSRAVKSSLSCFLVLLRPSSLRPKGPLDHRGFGCGQFLEHSNQIAARRFQVLRWCAAPSGSVPPLHGKLLVCGMQRRELVTCFSQLLLQTFDVFLPLTQHIGTLMHVEKAGIGGGSCERSKRPGKNALSCGVPRTPSMRPSIAELPSGLVKRECLK